MQSGETIRPVGFATDQPHQYSSCAEERALDVSIDRERMAERDQVGEPQRGEIIPPSPPAGGECSKIAVGKGEHHEIGRVLTKIDGRRGLLEAKTLAKDDVHLNAQPRFDRLLIDIAMLADHDELRAPRERAPGLVELVPYTLANRLHEQPHRL